MPSGGPIAFPAAPSYNGVMLVDPSTLFAYVLTVGALVLSPGPDTLLILRNTIGGGQKVGLATVAGVQVGLAGHTLLAILGVSMLVAASPTLFKGVAMLGALYLAWLGIKGFRGGAVTVDGKGASPSMKRAMVDAALTNLLNPKVIVLFLALLPNFVAPEKGRVTEQLLVLAVTLIVVNTIWQTPIAWAALAVRRWLGRPKVLSAVNKGSGAVLILFAGLMVAEHLL